jgi:hypothetical protein
MRRIQMGGIWNGEKHTMRPTPKLAFTIILALAAAGLFSILEWAQTEPAPAAPSAAQTTYQPKFRGDPAKSESESQILGYMRTVVRADKIYYKRHNEFASSLATLAGTGSFTKRMAHTTQRADYTIHYRAKKDGYMLSAIPQQFGPDHRGFYADEDGKIRVEEDKPAGSESPVLR